MAPSPMPSSTVPSASTSRAVAGGSVQPFMSCLAVIGGLHSRPLRRRQRGWRPAGRGSEALVLRDKINESVKVAMKAQDKPRLAALRLMNAAIQNATIEAERAGKSLAEDDLLGLLQKMIKQRQESVDIYEKGGRKELADQERGEIEVIKGFLPQQMSEAEARSAITDVIKDLQVFGM